MISYIQTWLAPPSAGTPAPTWIPMNSPPPSRGDQQQRQRPLSGEAVP
jgi:hypothetical protein